MNGKELLQKAHRTIENVYKAGYADGCNDKQHDLEYDYAKGLEDAWECARSVVDCKVPYDFWELASGQSMLAVFKHYSAKGAIEKIREYEEKQKEAAEIKVGDEVIYDREKCIVTAIANGGHTIMLLGLGGGYMERTTPDRIQGKRTGRHFSEIVNVLKQMQEGNE